MKRRDFLKLSLSAGVAAALPISLTTLTGCSKDENDPVPSDPVPEPQPDPEKDGYADTLVLGNIVTVDENRLFATAMTIKDGKVQYVGNQTYAEKLCKKGKTQRLEFPHGTTIYPGFMEAHCHGSSAGMIENTIKLFDYKGYDNYTRVIREYIAAHPDQPYYKISGWQMDDTNIPPTRKMLDDASTDKYIFGGSMDGHCFLMNTKTMEALGIDEAWCKHYKEDEAPVVDGQPTGYLSEAAAMTVGRWFPVDHKAATESILKWQEFAFKNGFVAAADAGVNLQGDAFHNAYLELAKKGDLKIRTRAYWNVVQADANEETVDYVARLKKECNEEFYKVCGLKIFIDGVVESHTALLHEPYNDRGDTRGLDRFDRNKEEGTLHNLVLMAHERNLPTHTHTIGDAAVTKMLDAIEYSKNTTGKFEIRDMLAHIELVKPEDIKRFAKYNVTAIVASLWGPKDSITSYTRELELLGEERAGGPGYEAMNSFVNMGVNTVQHTDYPVSQVFGVPRTIYCGVTRQTPEGGDASTRLAQEAVTRLEILKEMTINVAKLWGEENSLGSLTPGKFANFVVYDTDFIDDEAQKIADAKLLNVFVDGKQVYENK